MPLARGRQQRSIDYWPGFVDALSTMLLVIVFLLSVFMLAQFFLAREVSGKDTVLDKLNKQIAELTSLLAMERAGKADVEANLAALQATLDNEQKDKAKLQAEAAAATSGASGADQRVSAADQQLDAEKQISAQALAQIDILNQQIAAMRKQLGALEDALSASEARDRESQAKIADLGSRLNIALAQKVQELSRYRSDFFGRLRQILGDRPDIRTVGDRFVFQSEVLFDTGRATLNDAGKAELDKLASAIVQLDHEIPSEIPWVLRVDGHTDKRPIQSAQFHSNWDLSAARAIAVVQYLISNGVPPERLAAAGFGEFQPIDPGDTDEAYSKNRRIELKLTEK